MVGRRPGSLFTDYDLVLCALSMVPVGFRDLVEAASAGGFAAISVAPSVYRRAVRVEGLSTADMRRILDDNGVWVSEVEYVGNWLTPADDKPTRWAQKMSDDEVIELASAIGARSVIASHFGRPVTLEEGVAAFAALCDRTAGAGLTVALEFAAFATINDLGGAWEIVSGAGRPNGGILLDSWHYFRGRPDDALLAYIPPQRLVGIQLADADAELHGSLEDDILVRRLPGQGSFELAGLLGHLDALGVRAPIGVEVWDEQLLQRGSVVAAKAIGDAARAFLESIPGPVHNELMVPPATPADTTIERKR